MALNIDYFSNSLEIDLAKSVGEYFQLKTETMIKIENEVKKAVSNWKSEAKNIGINHAEIELMSQAFKFVEK